MERYIELAIFQAWLRGLNRDVIADEYGVSQGTVSNIIKNETKRLGRYDADSMRELARELRMHNMTPSNCVFGFRVYNILDKLKISEDNFNEFLTQIYDFSQKMNIKPEIVKDGLLEIAKISNDIPISELTDYFHRKREENENLEKENKKLQENIKILRTKESYVKKSISLALKDYNTTESNLAIFMNIKNKLEKFGISMEDTEKFANCVEGIKRTCDYSPLKVVEKYSDFKGFENEIEGKRERKEEWEKEIKELENRYSYYVDQLNLKSIKLQKLDELENLGFTIQDLKKFRGILIEISKEFKVQYEQIKERFFKYLDNYESIIALEDDFRKLANQIIFLQKEIEKKRDLQNCQDIAGTILKHLLYLGINEYDIVRIQMLIDQLVFDKRGDFQELNYSNDVWSIAKDLSSYSNLKLALERKEHDKKLLSKNDNSTYQDNSFFSILFIAISLSILNLGKQTSNYYELDKFSFKQKPKFDF
jgi:hypothetical protein